MSSVPVPDRGLLPSIAPEMEVEEQAHVLNRRGAETVAEANAFEEKEDDAEIPLPRPRGAASKVGLNVLNEPTTDASDESGTDW